MKLKKLTLVLCIIAFSFSLVACQTNLEKYEPYISELRENVFEGSSESMKVTAMTGKREKAYILDGHATGTQDFTVITIIPTQYSIATYTYKVNINGTDFAGEMVRHPFEQSYSVDLVVRAANADININIKSDNYDENFTLTSVLATDMISAQQALDISLTRLKTQIESLKTGKQLNAEIYIRLLANPIDASGGYHWYIAFIGDTQTIYAVLIDPLSMEVVAERT